MYNGDQHIAVNIYTSVPNIRYEATRHFISSVRPRTNPFHPRLPNAWNVHLLLLSGFWFCRFGFLVDLYRESASQSRREANAGRQWTQRTLFVTKCMYHASTIIAIQLRRTMRSTAKRKGVSRRTAVASGVRFRKLKALGPDNAWPIAMVVL